MSLHTIEYRVRIRNAANSADALILTTVRGDVAPNYPYLSETPRGDGASINPNTGDSMCASYVVRATDPITSGSSRLITSLLDDAAVGYRPNLNYRVSFVESRVDGGAWVVLVAGYLVLHRLVSAIEWELTIQDATRVQNGFEAFGASGSTAMSTVLTNFPTRGCVFGGPVLGGFLGMPDLGGWTMRVHRLGVAGSYRYYLEYVTGYGKEDWSPNKDINKFADSINDAVKGLRQMNQVGGNLASFTTVNDALLYGTWSGLVFTVRAVGALDSTAVVYRPCFPGEAGFALAYDQSNPDQLVVSGGIDRNNIFKGVFTKQDGQAALTDGALVLVRCLTILPTSLSPIYIDEHPADLLARVWTQSGTPYYATAITNLKDALGAQERIAVRITQPSQQGELLRSLVYAPYGVGVRVGTIGDAASNGLLVPFPTRKLSPVLPSITITDQDVVQGETSLPFENDVATGVRMLVLRSTMLQTFRSRSDDPDAPLDGVSETPQTLTILNEDTGALPSGTVEYEVPGMLHGDQSFLPYGVDWLKSQARTLFDRSGRGNPQGERMLIRGGTGDGINLGDEFLLDTAETPNQNKRLGDDPAIPARRVQAIRIDEHPVSRLVRYSDSGPNANQLATVPTLSIAQSADLPRSVADVTITNAAALNALGYGARIQVARTTGVAPSSGDYRDAIAFDDAVIPTGATRLGPFVAGQTIYVRARSEKLSNPASNFGSTANVTMASVDNPTSVAAASVGGDGSLEDLSWVIGTNAADDVTDIFLRLNGEAFAVAVKQITLPRGSVKYRLENLTPGTAYIGSVQHRNPNTNDVSNPVDVSFTTIGTTRVLAAPVSPYAFAGSTDPETGVPRRDGVYGIAVVAAEYPGLVEIAIATETAVGSGVFGAFSTIDTKVPSVLGDWTKFSIIAPNDQLTRRLKARHVQSGATSSAYTATVDVIPWTTLALPPLSTLPPIAEITLQASAQPGAIMVPQVTGVDPLGTSMNTKIVAKSANVSILAGAALGVLTTNPGTWQLSQPVPGQGSGSATFEAVTSDNRIASVTLVLPEATTLAQPQGTVAIDANGNWQATADGPANAVSFKYIAQTGSYAADATVAASGTVVTGSRTFSISGGPLSFGATIFIVIIPYTGASGTGTALPSIHIRGAYLSYSATKSVTYSRAAYNLKRVSGTGPWVIIDTNQGPANDAMVVGAVGAVAFEIGLPVGVTLVSVAFDGTWNSAATALGAMAVAFYKANSIVNNGSFSSGGGAQTVTVSLSGTVSASQALMIWGQFTGPLSGTADASQASFRDVTVTYTSNQPVQTV